MSNIPNKTKPEPMSAEQISDARRWFAQVCAPGHTRDFGDRLLAEVDRLSTALVAANAEIVTERSARADCEETIKRQARDTGDLEARLSIVRHERSEAERKLAVAVEALQRVRGKTDGNDPSWGFVRDAILAIASDAPAKAMPCGHTEPVTGCLCSAYAAAPASKPLVVGQRYRLADMPVGSKYRMELANPSGRAADTATVTANDHDFHQHSTWTRVLVSLPSAKADEGKAPCADCDTMDCCGRRATQPEPAPPALTRSEVVKMIDKAISERALKKFGESKIENGNFVIYDGGGNVVCCFPCADILRAALKEVP